MPLLSRKLSFLTYAGVLRILANKNRFTFTHTIEGLDIDRLDDEIRSYLRSINYRGKINISAFTPNSAVTVYSQHWINQLRNNKFVFWFCVIFQLWLVTLPLLWLLVHHYEVVHSVWIFSSVASNASTSSRRRNVYAAGRNEEELADFWAPGTIHAARERWKSGIVSDKDILRLDRIDTAQSSGSSSPFIIGSDGGVGDSG